MYASRANCVSCYLVKPKDSDVYCFRIRIPVDLQEFVGKSELRYSVRTSDPVIAKCRAMLLGRNLRQLLVLLRKKRESWRLAAANNRPETELKTVFTDLLQKCLQKWLAEAEEMRAMRSRPLTEDDIEDALHALSYLEDDARETLSACDYSRISRYVDELITEQGLNVTKDSPAYRTLCRELLWTHVRYLKTEQRRTVGDYDNEPDIQSSKQVSTEVQPSTSVRTDSSQTATPQFGSSPPEGRSCGPSVVASAESEPQSPVLTEVIKQYSEEQKLGNRWTAKTAREAQTSFDLLIELVGDVPVKTLSHLRDFKNKLRALPPNRRKNPQYRDKSIAEIISMAEAGKIEKTLSVITINKHLTIATSLFKWAVKNGYMDRNPAEGLQIATTKRDDEFRAVFTDDDLKKLFHSRDYVKDTHKHGYRFWLPVLALFTGARLTELCQLYIDDIQKVEPHSVADATQGDGKSDGKSPLYFIDINDKDDKKLKNKSSRRIVPLHDFIVRDLNFIAYVEKLKSQGHKRLFPELRNSRDGYGHKASRWFSEYRKKCGFKLSRKPDDERKDFHSFRHTVGNFLKQTGVDESVVREILGHSSSSITFGRYGKRYSPQVLKERAIDRLNYRINLDHLKQSRFVSGGKPPMKGK